MALNAPIVHRTGPSPTLIAILHTCSTCMIGKCNSISNVKFEEGKLHRVGEQERGSTKQVVHWYAFHSHIECGKISFYRKESVSITSKLSTHPIPSLRDRDIFSCNYRRS